MNLLECDQEPRVLEAVRSGRGASEWEEPLRVHVAACRICSDVVLVAQFLLQENECADAEAALPDAGLVWWKAQLLERRAAAERAVRPIAVTEKLAGAGIVALLLTGIILNWSRVLNWSYVQGGIRWLAGFLPAGSYPTATRVLADGHVIVLNGRGTMSVIDPLTDETLDAYTKTARSLSPYRDDSKPEKLPPIEHVLYIVRENRGYDDESAAPNHSKLAREFVLFDNFFVNADASAEGHNWATAGIATDYTQKLWPNSYAKRRDHYDYEGGEPANTPPAGYLWGNALSAGLSVRNYGYFVDNRAKVGSDGVQIDGVRDPALRSVTNTHYRGFDLDYPDVERARVFLEDLRQFESSGTMPRLMIMRLGNDHTDGTAPGKFADNDYALGLIVEGISKSRFWPATAIFVVEAAAPNGPDHVDSNRSPMLALSPYTRRGIVDSTMYNQSSVLRTIELILGMRPLTHFDAGARPLTAAFASAPNTAAYTAEQPRIRSDSLRQ